VAISQIFIVPSSLPEARNWPRGSSEMVRTMLAWPQYVRLHTMGKGCRSWGRGSCGTRSSGWIVRRIFRARGDRHSKNRSWMKAPYCGTTRRLSNLCGMKGSFLLSPSAVARCHSASSLSEKRYSGGGLYDSLWPGSFILAAGMGS